MRILRSVNLFLAFVLELCMLAAFGYFGFTYFDNTLVRCLVGLGLPLLAVVLWGVFAAPKSRSRLKSVNLAIFKLVAFLSSALLLALSNKKGAAALLAIAAVVNVALANIWGQEKQIVDEAKSR